MLSSCVKCSTNYWLTCVMYFVMTGLPIGRPWHDGNRKFVTFIPPQAVHKPSRSVKYKYAAVQKALASNDKNGWGLLYFGKKVVIL